MRLSETRETIITAIKEEKVDDLISFVKMFYEDKSFKFNRNELTDKKQKDFSESKLEEIMNKYEKSGKTEIKPNNIRFNIYSNSIESSSPDIIKTPYTAEELKKIESQLKDYSIKDESFIVDIKLKDEEFTVNPLESTVYIIDDFKLLNDFLYVWDLLTDEHLILNKSKKCTADDAVMFLSKSKNEESNWISANEKGVNNIDISDKLFANPLFKMSNDMYKRKDIQYADISLESNDKLLILCEEYINRKIICTHRIDNFVKNKYTLQQDYEYKRQTRLTWVAIISSIVISIGTSIWQGVSSDSSNSALETKRINLINENNQHLLDISGKLNSIAEIISEIDNSETFSNIQLYLEEISKDIDNINNKPSQ